MSEKTKRDTSPTRKHKKQPEVTTAVMPVKAKRTPGSRNSSNAIEQKFCIETAIMLLKKGHADLALDVLQKGSADEQPTPKNRSKLSD